jgi:hypothetical protein
MNFVFLSRFCLAPGLNVKSHGLSCTWSRTPCPSILLNLKLLLMLLSRTTQLERFWQWIDPWFPITQWAYTFLIWSISAACLCRITLNNNQCFNTFSAQWFILEIKATIYQCLTPSMPKGFYFGRGNCHDLPLVPCLTPSVPNGFYFGRCHCHHLIPLVLC